MPLLDQSPGCDQLRLDITFLNQREAASSRSRGLSLQRSGDLLVREAMVCQGKVLAHPHSTVLR
jgi:hypothetical protein